MCVVKIKTCSNKSRSELSVEMMRRHRFASSFAEILIEMKRFKISGYRKGCVF